MPSTWPKTTEHAQCTTGMKQPPMNNREGARNQFWISHLSRHVLRNCQKGSKSSNSQLLNNSFSYPTSTLVAATKMAPNCSELLNDTGSMSIFSTPTDPKVYIWLAAAHILVIILPASIAVAVAYHLVSRLSEHPSKLIFKWICLMCIVCPCSYAALMDASLIFDSSFLGDCEERWEGAIYWLAHSSLETSLLWIFALNPAVFYISIKRQTTRYSRWKVNAVLFGIMILATMESSLWVFLTESYVTTRCRVRGSFCLVLFEGVPPTAIMVMEYLRILIGVVPALVSVPLFVGLYVHKIKNSVRHFNPALSKSILNVCIALIVGAFLWNLPTMLIHFATYHGSQRTFVSLVTTYTLQLNFVLYPVLIIVLHKDLRESIITRFRRLFRFRCTGVHPTDDLSELHLPSQSHPPGNPQPYPLQSHSAEHQQQGDNEPTDRKSMHDESEDLSDEEWATAQEDWDPVEVNLKTDPCIEVHPLADLLAKLHTPEGKTDNPTAESHPQDNRSMESHLTEGKTDNPTELHPPEGKVDPLQQTHQPEVKGGPPWQPHPPHGKASPLQPEGTLQQPHPPEGKADPLQQPHQPEVKAVPRKLHPSKGKAGRCQQPHPPAPPQQPQSPKGKTGPLREPEGKTTEPCLPEEPHPQD